MWTNSWSSQQALPFPFCVLPGLGLDDARASVAALEHEQRRVPTCSIFPRAAQHKVWPSWLMYESRRKPPEEVVPDLEQGVSRADSEGLSPSVIEISDMSPQPPLQGWLEIGTPERRCPGLRFKGDPGTGPASLHFRLTDGDC